MNASLAYDYAEPLSTPLVEVIARDLRVGDTIVGEGLIPRRVTSVHTIQTNSRNPLDGWTVIGYAFACVADDTTYPALQRLSVLRPVTEAGH